MLLSLVVIYLPNLFSCQKSLSDSHYCGTTSRPQAARTFLLKVQFPLTAETQPQADIADLHIEHANREVMVELNGIEPLTPCLQSRCSPN
jgi:hypothetical protein